MNTLLGSMKYVNLSWLLVCFLIAAGSAGATGTQSSVECDGQCESGEKMVSYADGNNVTCSCVEAGQGMVETVANPETPQEGETPHQES